MKGQDSFHASRKGRCRGCGGLYHPGFNIWSPGKGQGAYHIRCQPKMATRLAVPEEIAALAKSKQEKLKGIYSNPF